MNNKGSSNYLYLNKGGRWSGFCPPGLDPSSDGTLRLAALPQSVGAGAGRPAPPTPTGPAGVAVVPDGSLFWTDPRGHRLLRRDGCDLDTDPVPCVGGEGGSPNRLREPRGLLFHQRRKTLFVSDTGNHRIQVFDPATFQLLGVWGQPMSEDDPQPGDAPGRFNRPTALADDSNGNVYVVEDGNARVQKFDTGGGVIPSFWDRVKAHAPAPARPVGIAVSTAEGKTSVFVLDAETATLFVYDPEGAYKDRFEVGNPADRPLGLAANGDSIYVGDAARLRICCYRTDHFFIGEGKDEVGVGGLTLDGRGNLVCVGDDGSPPILLSLTGGYARRRFLWGGPFTNPSGRPGPWHWLRARWGDLPAGAHAQLFLATTLPPIPPPSNGKAPWDSGTLDLSVLLGPGGADACRGMWVRAPLDAPECLFPGSPGGPVWVGVELTGGGVSSPALSQLRLDFDHETYLQYLPAVYREEPVSESFLARLLTLFEGRFSDAERRIVGLAALFDVHGAPDDRLDELGALFELDFPETWDATRKRRTIRGALAADGRRGTVDGLRQVLRDVLGVRASIEEPILQTAWWSLPGDGDAAPDVGADSLLGFTTRLAGVEPAGAVLDSTAVLDQSQLIEQDDYGAALFRDVAHRFSVLLYTGRSDDQTRADIRALLDREKPAHTTYQIHVVEPAMRVGYQARVGVDTVVAGPAPAGIGATTVLDGSLPGRVGAASRVGQTTRLGSDTAEY